MSKKILLIVAGLLGAGGLFILFTLSGSPDRRGGGVAPADARGAISPSAATELRDDRPAAVAEAPATREVQDTESTRSLAAATPGKREIRTTQTISGIVMSGASAVSRALLTVYDKGVRIVQQEANERGQFTLMLPDALGAARLRVTHSGHAPLERKLQPLRAGEKRLLGQIRLQSAAPLTGKVVDPDGEPVGGAGVRLRTKALGTAHNSYEHATRTDKKGAFRVPDAPLGQVEVFATAAGYGGVATEIQHRDPGDGVLLELEIERRLSLRLVDPNGRPAPGVDVILQPADRFGAEQTGATDAKGRVAFRGLGADDWEMRVADDDYRPVARTDLRADGSEYEVQVYPWPCVTGRVQAGGDEVPPGTIVRLVPASIRGDALRLAGAKEHPVARDGSFRVCGARPGQFLIRAEAPGFAPAHSDVARIQLQEDHDFGIISLQEGGTLELTLTADGGPIPNARVDVYISPPQRALIWVADAGALGNLVRSVSTDAQGMARVEHLAPQEVWLILRAEAHVPILEGPFTVPDGGARQVGPLAMQPGGFLSGQVLDASGDPVLGALLLLVGEQGRANVQLTSDADGRFRSPALSAGFWQVRARLLAGRGVNVEQPRDVQINAHRTTELEIRL